LNRDWTASLVFIFCSPVPAGWPDELNPLSKDQANTTMQTSDLDDLKSLVAELRAEHAAQKDREKRDAWTKYVSLTMVGVAVLAAIATLKGGGFSTGTLKEMNTATLNQTLASDQWSYFQAKSIKQNLYEIEVDRLATAPNPDAAAIAKVKAKVDQYAKDKADVTLKATDLEKARDAALHNALDSAEHSKAMGYSVTFFQVAIALGAMCLIVKKKPLWFAAMALGVVAAGLMIYVLCFMVTKV
jgi:hypothetical protein